MRNKEKKEKHLKDLIIFRKKELIAIIISILFLSLPINSAYANTSQIKKANNQDECPLCSKLNDDSTLSFKDLTYEEQEGLIIMVIQYKLYEEEIKDFDTLTTKEKNRYLNSLVSINQLFEIYKDIEDPVIKQKTNSLIDVANGNSLPFETNPSGNVPVPLSEPCLNYQPLECLKLLSVPIENFYNNVVAPVLGFLGYLLSEVNVTLIKEITNVIYEKTPNADLLLVSGIFVTLAKIGIWFKENIVPIFNYIKLNPKIVLSKGISIVTFSLWTILFIAHIFCRFHLCDSPTVKNNYELGILPKIKDIYLRLKEIIEIKIKPKSSDNSNPTIVTLDENSKPEISAFDGPSTFWNLKCGIRQKFYMMGTDPDGDNISLVFDWGDGTDPDVFSNLLSGSSQTDYKAWMDEGEYTCQFYVVDEHGLNSAVIEKTYTLVNKITMSKDFLQFPCFKDALYHFVRKIID